jgi:predicted ATPase/class 3 adenylate cyclase
VSDLPSGTVTFLFTDVEGSTRLLHELGAEGYAEALGEHRRALREAFGAHGGVEVDTQGDAFFVAFPTAPGALAAAADALAGLASGPIRVRMGIHTGTPHMGEEGYVGVDVHRAARIAACGHGGQVLVSASTAALIGADGLLDLGEHRLKDLAAPQRIYQLGEKPFPPLRTLNVTNLPLAASPLIGREEELAELVSLLSNGTRLVTVTGPGGTGKTRLALQGAAELVGEFADGVFWVPLQALSDAELVLPAVAQALGVGENVSAHLRPRHTLLLLDNLEHLLEAARALAELLAACAELRLLVTSRAPLRISGERELRLDPLPEREANTLFVERALAVGRRLEPDATVGAICRRLDNLPLALELAAARTKLLEPPALLARLERSLPFLTGGRRDAPERQRTLRATLEWSYQLLDEETRSLLARLAVFAGSFTIGAAEEVCEADLEALAALIDFSLLKPVGDDRFLMLETIREYTLELLDESDEADDVRRRHAEHFLALVESAPGAADSPALSANVADTSAWRQQIDSDYGNVRAALEWFRETGDLDREFRLVFPLAWLYIWVRGGMAEAGRMFEAVLSRAGESDLALRVDALQSLSHFGTYLDRETRRRLAEESLVLARKLGDEGRIEWSLRRLALRQDDPAESRRMLLQCEVLARELPEEGRLAWIHQNLALIAVQQGDYEEARVRLEQSLVIFERIGGKWQAMNSLSDLATLAVLEERYDDAGRLLADTLRRALDLGSTNHISQCFDDVAAVALAGGDARAASRLLGAAAALRAQTGDESSEDDYTDFELRMREKTAAAARSRLAERFELEWEAGKTLTLDQAVALALDETRLDA